MTYKCAMAGVPYGGGKAVIMKEHERLNLSENKALLESYAEIVNSLGGDFTTGKDVGIGDEDVILMSRISPYINGHFGSEDPSIYAAIGVFLAIRAIAKKVYGSTDLNGKKVSVKGLGQVGFELAKLIYGAGGKLIVTDIDKNKLKMAEKSFKGIKIASPAEIHKTECDIYSPCALGAEFGPRNISELNCGVICGAANNQLVSPEAGRLIMERGIIYVPDYVANAGGLIAVVDGFRNKKFDDKRARKNLLVIKDNTGKVFDISFKQHRPPQEVADELAEKIIYG